MRVSTAILKTGLTLTLVLGVTACGVTQSGYTPSERELSQDMSPSIYQPATREMRDNIETQELFAQAAFWSKEYQLNPSDLEAIIKLSSAVRRLGNAQRALEITQVSRAIHPRDPYLIAENAAALIALEKGREAVKILDQGLQIAPGYARLWSLKGAALDQAENYNAARQHYSKALSITPQDPNIMANMGLSYALAGDAATAEQWLTRAASMPNASDSVQQNLSLVRQLQGKPALSASPAPRQYPQTPASDSPSYAQAPTARTAQTYGRISPHNQSAQAVPRSAPSNFTVMQPNSGIQSASDAARAAAQRSQTAQSSNSYVSRPQGMTLRGAQPTQSPNLQARGYAQAPTQPQPSAQKGNILSRIIGSIGPRRSTQAMQAPTQYAPSQQAQTQQGWGQAPYQPNVQMRLQQPPASQAYYATPRTPARTRY